MSALISAWPPFDLPVTAVTVTPAEMSVPQFVMNCLAPLITHCPSRTSARVLGAPASEPVRYKSTSPSWHDLDPLRHFEFAQRFVDLAPGADKAIPQVQGLSVLVAVGHPEKDLAQASFPRPIHDSVNQRGSKPAPSETRIHP